MKWLCLFAIAAGAAFSQNPSPEQRLASLEARLSDLEDKETIRALLLDYGRTLDARDLAAYANLFAEQGEWIGGFGSVKGRAELLAFMRKNVGTSPNTAKSYHLLTNFVIDVNGDRATAHSRWSYVVPSSDKKPVLEHSGRYEDVLVREAGRWRFQKRVVYNDLPPVQ